MAGSCFVILHSSNVSPHLSLLRPNTIHSGTVCKTIGTSKQTNKQAQYNEYKYTVFV